MTSHYNGKIYSDIDLYVHINVFNEEDNTPSFRRENAYHRSNHGVTKFGTPIFLNTLDDDGGKLHYAYISKNHITAYEFKADHQKNTTLTKITNNGIVQTIEYSPLSTAVIDPVGTYSGGYDQVYPFVNINIAPSLKLVKKITESDAFGIMDREQNFKYSGAVSHAKGLGFLGFQQVKRSNWHGEDVSTVWSTSNFDMEKRGAISQSLMSLSTYTGLGNYFKKTDYTYQTQLTADKIYINKQTQVVIEDVLQNVTTTKSFVYDSYNNPKTIITIFPGGSTTTNLAYSNNLSPFNQYYHVGRITNKTVTKVLGGNSFSTEKKYVYDNNLLVQTSKKGNGTDWIDTYYQYDVFGNVIQKTLSAPNVADRVEHFEFDPSGRFMTKSIDIEGLATAYTYEPSTGNPLSVTDPFGLTTTYKYDGWQRLIQTTDYLGHKTNYSYESYSWRPGNMLKTIDYEQGKDKKVWYNSFGWIYRKGSLSLNSLWIYKDYEYDISGRKIKDSTFASSITY